EYRFSIFNIGPHEGAYGPACYVLPDHVSGVNHVYCRDKEVASLKREERARLEDQVRAARRAPRGKPSRVLGALRRLNLDEGTGNMEVADKLLADLVAGALAIPELLHGREAFELIAEISERLAPHVSFLDLFWHFRAIHVPILKLLLARPPAARCYHTVSTG